MRTLPFISAFLIVAIARSAFAVKVADITRIDGQRTNVLTGHGLVFGLKGTGDGGAYLPAIRPLAKMLEKFNDPATIADLASANNVAVVTLTAVVTNGAHEGDHVDVYVTSEGAASSLKGGRLFVTPMMGPDGQPFIPRDEKGMPLKPMPFALAEGAIVTEDITTPTSGMVKGGAVLEVDLPAPEIRGRFTLILDDGSAGWPMASTIAKLINEAGDTGETIAQARDAKTVDVLIPATERERPDSFISGILRLPVPIVSTEARVEINEKTSTLIVTGDVEISPVVISHKGLTISTVTPQPVPSARAPVVTEKGVVALDTTTQGGAKLQDLANAFDQLKVPAEDRITIVKELHRSGKLHAKLYLNGVLQ